LFFSVQKAEDDPGKIPGFGPLFPNLDSLHAKPRRRIIAGYDLDCGFCRASSSALLTSNLFYPLTAAVFLLFFFRVFA